VAQLKHIVAQSGCDGSVKGCDGSVKGYDGSGMGCGTVKEYCGSVKGMWWWLSGDVVVAQWGWGG
jgi:hypothetical protein